jgi:hypothetical protein
LNILKLRSYVSGKYKTIRAPPSAGLQTVRLRRVTPLLPVAIRNLHTVTLQGGHRINNICENWNNAFRHLVGHKNTSIWLLLDCIRKNEDNLQTTLALNERGEAAAKRFVYQNAHMLNVLKN